MMTNGHSHGLKLTALCLLVCAGCATSGSKDSGGPRGSLFGSKGAPWTIQCLEIQGLARMRQIEPFAESMRRTTGIRPKDVFVRDEPDGFARLYYGTYYRRTDQKTRKRSTPPQLQTDMELIKQLGNESGQRYFLQALAVRMPMPDVGDPQWALSHAKGKYSLQVAVFEPNDNFWEYKQTAAEYCEFLRKKGHEAYYHHASASSMVTVGSFGKEAVVNMPQGLPKYSDEVLALQKNELLQHNLLNGSVYYVRDGKGGRTPVPSRLVEIPHTTFAASPAPATPKADAPTVSAGSGFLVGRALVVTNYHVIRDARLIRCFVSDAPFDASVIAHDNETDLALLRLEKEPPSALPVLELGDSAKVAQGERVYAMGYPLTDVLGKGLHVHEGIVSSVVGLEGRASQFQVEMSLNPGNSGGPLLDGTGRVVGIITSKLSLGYAIQKGTIPEGVTFAIKSDLLRSLVSAAGVSAQVRFDTTTRIPTTLKDVASTFGKAVVRVEVNQ